MRASYKIGGKIIIVSVLVCFFQGLLCGQVENNYYLPEIEYDAAIPDPKNILGYQIGEWHPSHDQIKLYLKTICELSPICEYEEYARTHEQKALFFLKISDQKNLENQDAIRAKRDKLVDPYSETKDKDVPLVIYQGYSIHGNESSGASASMMVAYYLIAGQGSYLKELRKNNIILLDPCYNPDGLTRFSTWANMHKHTTLSADPAGREFNEVWPGGRTNHYWFDLNRDWLFNIHPSSKGRIETFQKWKPDILTDHHEMGSNSSFFFQPGVPSRTNPNTPQLNQDLTDNMANYHRKNLDSLGCKYFSKERFDDYYYGKGSTYPDIQGCIGILFEQASSRGHLRETKNGLLGFPFTIRNQVTTSLSTQRAALALRDKILQYKIDFYKNQKDREGSYVFECEDSYKAEFFLKMLDRHDITVGRLAESQEIEGKNFPKESSYVVSKDQRQSGLIKTIFEPVSTFRDSIFYDVSAWTVPYALDLKHVDTKAELKTTAKPYWSAYPPVRNPNCYVLKWSDYETPRYVYALQKEQIDFQVLKEKTEISDIDFAAGTVIIPFPSDEEKKKSLTQLLDSLDESKTLSNSKYKWKPSKKTKLDTLRVPQVAMIVGSGINPYEAGSTWYQLDKRLRIPVTMLDFRQFNKTNLSRYTHIILPDGKYGELDKPEKLQEWIAAGGTLIAMRRAITFASQQGWTPLNIKQHPTHDTIPNNPKARGAQVIGGAIIASKINLDHPLFYGYEDEDLPVFKRGVKFYEPSKKTLASPMVYTEDPMMSGYASKRNVKLMTGAGGVFCHKLEKGKIISLVDNPNFRGYWLGGSQLFANCLFMSDLITEEMME